MVITGDLVNDRVHWKPESSKFSIVGHKPQITGADPGIFYWGLGVQSLNPKTLFYRCLWQINSTPILRSPSLTSFYRLKERGYRSSCRHIDCFERRANVSVNAGQILLLCELIRADH